MILRSEKFDTKAFCHMLIKSLAEDIVLWSSYRTLLSSINSNIDLYLLSTTIQRAVSNGWELWRAPVIQLPGSLS